jgi:hypothetical protein
VEPAPVAETPTWQQELDKVDAKTLRSHPRIAGIVGSAIQADRQRDQEERERKGREETEQELLKFSEENADYIKDKYPRAYEHLMGLQQERARRELETVGSKTVHQLASEIGRAMNDVPEWKELTEADHQKLAEAVVGRPDAEVIAIFNRVAIDLLAERRAEKKHATWKEKELAKEREAARQEEAAKLLKGSEAPDTTPSKGQPAGVNINGMSDAEFDDYWKKKHR